MDRLDNDDLIKEQERLYRLVNEALKNGTPIGETYEIMAQCHKIDKMMLEREPEGG